MHGASLAAACAGLFAEKLGHDLASGDTLGQSVDVITVGGADVIVLAEAGLDDTCREGNGEILDNKVKKLCGERWRVAGLRVTGNLERGSRMHDDTATTHDVGVIAVAFGSLLAPI